MNDSDTTQAEINALEDACLGIALMIDKQTDEDDRGGPQDEDPFFNIIMSVLQLRGEHDDLAKQHDALDEVWEGIRTSMELSPGAFENAAQRGYGLGKQLREPPEFEENDDELLRLGETDSGRTIWGVNASGWDKETFEKENVTLGMNADGSIEPVRTDEPTE